jgi:hypothetical protein
MRSLAASRCIELTAFKTFKIKNSSNGIAAVSIRIRYILVRIMLGSDMLTSTKYHKLTKAGTNIGLEI